MIDNNFWIQQVSQRLAANNYQPLPAEKYQPQNFKYVARRSRFELSKFGMAENFFTFAEIPNLTPEVLRQYTTASFKFANANKKVSLPNGLFVATFCFAVAMTANLHPQLAQYVRETMPASHWGAFELPVVFDLANGNLCYYEKTPLWGAAYYKGFRKEIQSNLS